MDRSISLFCEFEMLGKEAKNTGCGDKRESKHLDDRNTHLFGEKSRGSFFTIGLADRSGDERTP